MSWLISLRKEENFVYKDFENVFSFKILNSMAFFFIKKKTSCICLINQNSDTQTVFKEMLKKQTKKPTKQTKK